MAHLRVRLLTWRKSQRFPLRATAHKKWGHRGETAAPKSAASFGDRGETEASRSLNSSGAPDVAPILKVACANAERLRRNRGLGGWCPENDVPVRALTGTWEDERGALIHGYSGTSRTIAVLRSRDSYTRVYRGISLWTIHLLAVRNAALLDYLKANH